MRRRCVVLSLVLATVLVAACAPVRPVAQVRFDPDDQVVAAMPTMIAPMGASVDDGLVSNEMQDEQNTSLERVVLKNASLVLVVADVDAKVAQISALADEFGGWVVNAQVSRTRDGEQSRVASASIVVRVDANRLDQALALIKEGVDEVESESVTGQDVTQDYVDLSSQVANLEAAERQLQEIMDRAEKTEDVMNVYNQLVSVRGQIETMRGRLRYYDEAATYSSVQITLRPTPVIQPVEIAGWQPLETARNAFQALVNVLRGVADVVIAVVVFGLPLLILGIPLWVVRRRHVMRAAK